MMRFIRENAKFVLVIIIFVVGAFVGTIFLVWGWGGAGGSSEGTVVAWVEDQEVPYSEYLRDYDDRVEFYRQFYKDLSLKELEEKFHLKKNALDAVIDRRLLLAEASRLGLEVSEEELKRGVEENPAFQEGGQFNPAVYRQVLAAAGQTAAAYEERKNIEILLDKVMAIVQDAVQITEKEAWEKFRKEREKIQLNMLSLAVESFREEVSVTEEEIREAFEEEPEIYRRPERIQLFSLSILASDFVERVSPTKEELKEYYEENTEKFKSPKMVRARHILFKLPENASLAESDKVKERASFVLNKAREGADFSVLAREFSQDATGPQGGDLGYFAAGQMVPSFEQAAFSLKKGEISEIIRTRYGFHIIKVEDIREASAYPFEEVIAEVRQSLLQREARLLASLRAEEVNNDLYDEELEEVAKKYSLEVGRTDFLTRQDSLPGLGYRPEILDGLFSLAEGEISEIYYKDGNYFVYLVKAKKPAYLPDLEEVKEEIRSDLIIEKVEDRALAEAQSLFGDLKRGESLKSVAKRVNGVIRETVFFGRSEFVPEVGVGGESFEEAFALPREEFGGPLLAKERVWLYQVVDRQEADKEDFSQEKEEIISNLRDSKKELLFKSWLEDLRKVRPVKINEAVIGEM